MYLFSSFGILLPWIPLTLNIVIFQHSLFDIILQRQPRKLEHKFWSKSLGYGHLSFLKVCCMPLHFYEGPTLVPVFNKQKKSEKDFAFMEKGGKQK